MAAPALPPLDPRALLRALVRGGLLSGLYGLIGVTLGAGLALGGPGWSLVAGVLLGLVAVPSALLERAASSGPRREWWRDLPLAGLSGALAAGGLLLAALQLGELRGRASGAAPLAGLHSTLALLGALQPSTLAYLVVAWATPFAATTLARSRGWPARGGVTFVLLAAGGACLLGLWLLTGSLAGAAMAALLLVVDVGQPVSGLPPLLGAPIVLLHPLVGAFALPIAAAAGDRLVPACRAPDHPDEPAAGDASAAPPA